MDFLQLVNDVLSWSGMLLAQIFKASNNALQAAQSVVPSSEEELGGLAFWFLEKLYFYGYIILFLWSIIEGELGLIYGGLMCLSPDLVANKLGIMPNENVEALKVTWVIFWAGLGGVAGDQIYFYTGRFNKKYIQNEFKIHQRKFALAHLLLQKYGWPIIFVQRYLYGLRTVIPMAIGTTKYSARQFTLINFISAFVWASMTIIPTWYFGEYVLDVLVWFKKHWYLAIIAFICIIGGFWIFVQKTTEKSVNIKRIKK